jgi:hypothetical protein
VVPFVQKYYIYQDGVKIGETTSTNFSQEDVGYGSHDFCVVAVYDTGAQSAEVCKPVTCNETCSAPTNLDVVYSEECDKAVISWNAPATGNTKGYKVYRDAILLTAEAITATTYTDEDFDKTEEHTWSVETVCETTSSNDVKMSKPRCNIGIAENQSEVVIFPNPASRTVTVQMNNFQKVEIYNPFGQLIEVSHYTTVDVSAYSSGIYFFKVYDSDSNMTVKRVTVAK